jgi:hypothetical protein
MVVPPGVNFWIAGKHHHCINEKIENTFGEGFPGIAMD